MGRIEELRNRVEEVKKVNRMIPKTNINVILSEDEADFLISRLQIAEEALAFYANNKNYRHVESAAYSDVVMDEGGTAQKALEQIQKD